MTLAAGSRTSVITYHGVGACPTPDRLHNCLCLSTATFAAHMEFLARHRQVVPLEDVAEGRRPAGRPAVAITFDDGYRNVLTNAAPILARHRFPATVFVPTKWIGSVNSWDEGGDCFPLEIMGPDALREADQLGISVEAHGHQHIDLRTVDRATAADDLHQSVLALQAVIGRRPRYLAYPYGGQSSDVRALTEAAGFAAAFGFNELGAGTYGLERLSLDGSESRLRLRLKTAGGYLARRHSRLGELAGSAVRLARRRPTYA